MLLLKVFVASLIVYFAETTGPFSRHKVIRVRTDNAAQGILLRGILQETKVDVWHYPSDVRPYTDVRLSPVQLQVILPRLLVHNIKYQVLIDDVQSLMDRQRSTTLRYHPRLSEFEYTKYHTLDEIFAWMENITSVYKDRSSLFNVTMSYEGRPLMGLKISNPKAANADRPAFWIQGGIHAREWISPATVIFMAGQMLDLYKLDPELTEAVDKFDWYILPVVNADGYTYTWSGDENRLWRKTRSPQGECVGVDPNRNWDTHWCEEGASKDPCSDTYCGPKVFSEVEVKGVAEFVENIPNVKAFIDVHSYSQLWMSPWGYTADKPKDFKAQDEGSVKAVDALEKVYGTKYEHGDIASTIYVSSGCSTDWAYGKRGVEFAYAVELRDTGEYGFLLPEDQILPTGKETLEAVRVLANYVHDKELY